MSTSRTPESRAKRLAQTSLEFSLFVIVVFVIFSIFLYSLRGRVNELNSQRDAKDIQDIVNRLREEIYIASVVHDGYSRDFTLPSKLNSQEYELEINGNLAIGTIGSIIYSVNIPDVTGSPMRGDNTIRASGGEIHLN